MPLERRVNVVPRAPPNGHVPWVVQLHLFCFVVASPVHGTTEYVRFAVVTPDNRRVYVVQLVGQTERCQRFRVSWQRIVAVEHVKVATWSVENNRHTEIVLKYFMVKRINTLKDIYTVVCLGIVNERGC